MSASRIIIADDHPLFRGALKGALDGVMPGSVIVEAGGFNEMTQALAEPGQVELVLLDLTMPGVEGFSGLLYLRAEHPGIPVLVVSAKDDPSIIRSCIEFGSSGFLPKTSTVEEMRNAVTTVLDGGIWTPADIDLSASADPESADIARRIATLTPQQIRVLMMLSQGLLNKQIAYELDVSEATVKAHVSAILQKLDVDSRTQAVILASKIAKVGGVAA